MSITYKDIKGFPGYRVGDDGSVQSFKYFGKWRLLKQTIDHDGYQCVYLSNSGKSYNRRVHRLILESFVGPRPKDHECRHLNSVKIDNRLENLAWGTKAENVQDRKSNGLPWNPRRLNEDLVKSIWRLKSERKNSPEIAVTLGLSRSNVWTVLSGRGWKWVEKPEKPEIVAPELTV